jgi:glutamate dehydrogenase/leucine dehydrogenase
MGPDLLSREFEHESLKLFSDPETGMRGCVAIHSTALGPAMGGLRLSSYDTISSAAVDALRLSRAMSFKTAAADLDLGGGKAVLVDDGAWTGELREARMRAFGVVVEGLLGSYVTAEDVGTSPADMESIAIETSHVAGRPLSSGGRGDPSPATAETVFAAISAAVEVAIGRADLEGVRVGVEGVGHVGKVLVALLRQAGAMVEVCDLDEQRAAAVAAEWGAEKVSLAGFAERDLDVFAPCALGGVVRESTVTGMKCRVVAGAANNQLVDYGLATVLDRVGILYVPDFVANSGGIIHVGAEPLGFDEDEVRARVAAAGRRTGELLREAEARHRTPLEVALQNAEARLQLPGTNLPDGGGH